MTSKAQANKPIVLGCEVRDKVTGFSGQTMVKHLMLGGNIMWSVQPKAVPKKGTPTAYPEAVALDGHMLERTGDGISAELPLLDSTVEIKVGEEVEDKITGYKGTATELTYFQNGCVYFTVEGPLTQKLPENLPKAKLFLHSRLKRTAAGVSNDTKLVPPPVEAGQPRPPGGPSIRNSGAAYSRLA